MLEVAHVAEYSGGDNLYSGACASFGRYPDERNYAAVRRLLIECDCDIASSHSYLPIDTACAYSRDSDGPA